MDIVVVTNLVVGRNVFGNSLARRSTSLLQSSDCCSYHFLISRMSSGFLGFLRGTSSLFGRALLPRWALCFRRTPFRTFPRAFPRTLSWAFACRSFWTLACSPLWTLTCRPLRTPLRTLLRASTSRPCRTSPTRTCCPRSHVDRFQ